MLSMKYKDIREEPTLNITPDSNDELRADINTCSFRHGLQIVFVDLRVFYPFAPSYCKQLLAIMMKTLENQDKKNIEPANLRW